MSCRAGEDAAFFEGDGQVGGVWDTAPSAGRFTLGRAKPPPPHRGVAEQVPIRNGCRMWGSVSREGGTGEGREKGKESVLQLQPGLPQAWRAAPMLLFKTSPGSANESG